jgi:hypothetical protein
MIAAFVCLWAPLQGTSLRPGAAEQPAIRCALAALSEKHPGLAADASAQCARKKAMAYAREINRPSSG